MLPLGVINDDDDDNAIPHWRL